MGDRPHRGDPRLQLPEIRRRLTAHRFTAAHQLGGGRREAATALVIAPGPEGPDLAFIRRTERHGDRWSGQMALPGGKRDPGDVDLAATARRETHEEIGLVLGDHVARLPDQTGRRTSDIRVASFVHLLEAPAPLRPEPGEVAEALWIPLHRLVDPSAAAHIRRTGRRLPAIDHDGRMIWGLTHRILTAFLDVIGTGIRR